MKKINPTVLAIIGIVIVVLAMLLEVVFSKSSLAMKEFNSTIILACFFFAINPFLGKTCDCGKKINLKNIRTIVNDHSECGLGTTSDVVICECGRKNYM